MIKNEIYIYKMGNRIFTSKDYIIIFLYTVYNTSSKIFRE